MPEPERELSDFEAYIDYITTMILLSVHIPGACYMVYAAIRYAEWSKIFRSFGKLIASDFKYGPGNAKPQDESQAHNHLQGLKDIGKTYIGETYTVFRQGSFNQSLRK